jgi:hypothetical protein
LLAQVLQLDAQNEWAWYYLSRTMTTAPGIAWCGDRVLAINPILRALESRADDRDAELEVRREAEALGERMERAEATIARLQSETESVIEADRRLAGELRDLRSGASHTTDLLGAVQRRLS